MYSGNFENIKNYKNELNVHTLKFIHITCYIRNRCYLRQSYNFISFIYPVIYQILTEHHYMAGNILSIGDKQRDQSSLLSLNTQLNIQT